MTNKQENYKYCIRCAEEMRADLIRHLESLGAEIDPEGNPATVWCKSTTRIDIDDLNDLAVDIIDSRI